MHNCREYSFIIVEDAGVPFTWRTMRMVPPRAVPEQVALMLVLLHVGRDPVHRVSSVCGWQYQVRNGAEAQMSLCRQW